LLVSVGSHYVASSYIFHLFFIAHLQCRARIRTYCARVQRLRIFSLRVEYASIKHTIICDLSQRFDDRKMESLLGYKDWNEIKLLSLYEINTFIKRDWYIFIHNCRGIIFNHKKSQLLSRKVIHEQLRSLLKLYSFIKLLYCRNSITLMIISLIIIPIIMNTLLHEHNNDFLWTISCIMVRFGSCAPNSA